MNRLVKLLLRVTRITGKRTPAENLAAGVKRFHQNPDFFFKASVERRLLSWKANFTRQKNNGEMLSDWQSEIQSHRPSGRQRQ